MCAERTAKYENKKNYLNPNISFDLLPHHTVNKLKSFFSEGTCKDWILGKMSNFAQKASAVAYVPQKQSLSNITLDS